MYMERGAEYDWDDANRGHIALHGIEPHEVEEVLADFTVSGPMQVDTQSGERRFLELGITKAGRILVIIWTPRGERMRPVTAWPANRRLRKQYQQARKDTL